MSKLDLSVIIPAYNEEENIRRGALDSVYTFLKTQKFTWEVLVVDDESRDSTAKLVALFAKKHKGFRLVKEPHRGKGGTVIAGVLKSNGKIILFTDMDQATPIGELTKFLPKFSEGVDIVIGSREGRKGAPLFRKMMAWGFSFLRFMILRLPYKDTQCGFKAFKKDAAGKIFKKMEIFNARDTSKNAGVTAGFDLEMLYLARKLGLKVAEVEVEWRHKDTERVSALRDSWEGLRDLLRVRLNAIMGRYRT